MSSSKDFKDFVIDQFKGLDGITVKPMMGEFLLYCDGKLFGGIYDDRLLIKKTKTNAEFGLCEEIPYPSAKPMYMAENLDDADYLSRLIKSTCEGLK